MRRERPGVRPSQYSYLKAQRNLQRGRDQSLGKEEGKQENGCERKAVRVAGTAQKGEVTTVTRDAEHQDENILAKTGETQV